MGGMQGLDRLLKKLDSLGGNSHQALKTGVYKAAKLVQGDAKDLCAVSDGELRNSIGAKVYEQEEKIIGAVFTNKEHAPYVEFGTGPAGRGSPKDLPPKIAGQIQYRQDAWWIHESQIDAETAEKYHFFRIETPEGVFYKTDGQPAQPFLYPALKQNEAAVKAVIKEHIQKEIKKVAKG